MLGEFGKKNFQGMPVPLTQETSLSIKHNVGQVQSREFTGKPNKNANPGSKLIMLLCITLRNPAV